MTGLLILLIIMILTGVWFYFAWFKAFSGERNDPPAIDAEDKSLPMLSEFDRTFKNPFLIKSYSLLSLIFSVLAVCIVLIEMFGSG